MGGQIVRLAAVWRREKMRRARYVRQIAVQAIKDVGGSQAVLVAGHKARLKLLSADERQLWAEVEAELGRIVGFTWWWGTDMATVGS